ncbi:MAG TPA: hypothetical protein VGJ34_08110 [Gaiellaceae bacterium]|jgi:hypothetical protein
MRCGLAILLAVSGLALAACGGGGGGGARGESLTPAEFRQQADAICAEFEGKLNDLGSPSSVDELAEFVDKAVPIIEEGNDRLQALEPPDELADDWNKAMALQDKNLDLTHDLQDAIHASDDAKMQELVAKLDASDAESTRLARKIGLENCGQSSS